MASSLFPYFTTATKPISRIVLSVLFKFKKFIIHVWMGILANSVLSSISTTTLISASEQFKRSCHRKMSITFSVTNWLSWNTFQKHRCYPRWIMWITLKGSSKAGRIFEDNIWSWAQKTFATESSAGCLSTVQSGDLGKTEVEVGGIVGRPNSIGGRTLPHGGGAPQTLTPSNYLKLVLCCLFVSLVIWTLLAPEKRTVQGKSAISNPLIYQAPIWCRQMQLACFRHKTHSLTLIYSYLSWSYILRFA